MMKHLRSTRLPLYARVVLLQLGIVVLVAGITSASLLAILTTLHLKRYQERALSVAQTVALMPSIREAFRESDPSATIQPLAEAIRRSTGVSFIVVSNRHLIRYSHPNPALVGQPLTAGVDPEASNEDNHLGLDGQIHLVQEVGSLGPSIRAKVPIFGDDGHTVIGVVSVGVLEARIQRELLENWPPIAAGILVSLLLGAVASFVLTSHVKRELFDLEPDEIAALLEQREAMLHGIREGVVAVDRRGIITIVNDEARRVLGLPEQLVGWPIADILPRSGLPEVLASGRAEPDQSMVLNGRAVLVSRIPVFSRRQLVGAIATLRDQTETQALLQELSGTRSYLEALRAQAHEFANKLHTIAGLLELGWRDQAIALISQSTRDQQSLIEDLPRRIVDPPLAALLLGKASIATERGISFLVTPGSRLGPVPALSTELVTIVGNLVENAFEATEGRPHRWVRVAIVERAGQIRVTVCDSGPGVPPELRTRIFEGGFSTKRPNGGTGQRGVGLVLVQHAISRLGGEIRVRNRRGGTEGGAIFQVTLPAPCSGSPNRSHAEGIVFQRGHDDSHVDRRR